MNLSKTIKNVLPLFTIIDYAESETINLSAFFANA